MDGGGNEKQQCQEYWNDLLNVMGIKNVSEHINYEKKAGNGNIDCYITTGVKIIVEQKSSNVSLDAETNIKTESISNGKRGRNRKIKVKRRALEQALMYNKALSDSDKVDMIITCNFKELRIYEVDRVSSEYNMILNCLIGQFIEFERKLRSIIVGSIENKAKECVIENKISKAIEESDKNIENIENKISKTIEESDKNIENIGDKKRKEKNGIIAALRNRKKEGGNNEFYTPLYFIEAELEKHSEYKNLFKDKIIYCNCDDPFWSKFYEFFKTRAVSWGIKGIITTSYKLDGLAIKLEWDRDIDYIVSDDTIIPRIQLLNGNGDFRSDECIELMKKADIIVTNPPFSSDNDNNIYAEFIEYMFRYSKKFVIIGNHIKMLNSRILKRIVLGKINVGYEFYDVNFHTIIKPECDECKVRRQKVCWFTNLAIQKENEFFKFKRKYKGNEQLYPKYRNYDIIFVDRNENIPDDYFGLMAVPITFLAKYNKEQFELVNFNNSDLPIIDNNDDCVLETGKKVFAHILIQRKK